MAMHQSLSIWEAATKRTRWAQMTEMTNSEAKGKP